MRALVTGGAGFIGSNLSDALLARGDEAIIVDDLSTGRRENIEQALANGATLVEADIRDRAAIEEIAGRERPEAIFHLAPRSTCGSRSPTRPSTPRSTSAAPPTCSRPPAPPRCARVVFSSTGGAIYGEATASSCRSPRTRRWRRRPPTPEQVRRRGLPLPL